MDETAGTPKENPQDAEGREAPQENDQPRGCYTITVFVLAGLAALLALVLGGA